MAPGESEEVSYTPLQQLEGIGTMSEHEGKIIKDLKVMAFNINSRRRRAQHAMEILRTEEPDILFLQETKVSDKEFPQALIDFATGRRYHVYFRCQKQQLGVALFTKHMPQRITFEIEGVCYCVPIHGDHHYGPYYHRDLCTARTAVQLDPLPSQARVLQYPAPASPRSATMGTWL
jgi:exonuclease III